MPNTTDQVTTAEQLAAMPDDGRRYELVKGVLQMMSPASRRHGRIGARLLAWITIHVEERQLGETYNADTGFLIRENPDTVCMPDVAFVARNRLTQFADDIIFLPLAPDFVAEVVSPSDRAKEVERKAQEWLTAGVQLVLVVDPQSSVVREYRSGTAIQEHAAGVISLHDVLPGFQLDVGKLLA